MSYGAASERTTWATLLKQPCDVQCFARTSRHSIIEHWHRNIQYLHIILTILKSQVLLGLWKERFKVYLLRIIPIKIINVVRPDRNLIGSAVKDDPKRHQLGDSSLIKQRVIRVNIELYHL